MSAENRLTADQLAALSPGDTVCIETASGVGRSRLTTGTVVRVSPFELFVSTKGAAGGTYIERFSRRDGIRRSSGRGAELVSAEPDATVEQRRKAQQLDALWLAWRRNRGDVENLRRLQEAIGTYLEGAQV